MGLSRTKGETKKPAAKKPMPPLPALVPMKQETKRGFFKRVFDWIKRTKPEAMPAMPPLPPSLSSAQEKNIVDNIAIEQKALADKMARRQQNAIK